MARSQSPQWLCSHPGDRPAEAPEALRTTDHPERAANVLNVDDAIARAQQTLLALQDPASGYFWAEVESNVSQTAEYVMLH